jgi:cytochrome c oxidase subunit 2
MAVPATSTLLEAYDSEDAEMDILVTGYQWKWKYEYLAERGRQRALLLQPRHAARPRSTTAAEKECRITCWRWTSRVVIPVDTKGALS